MRRLQQVAGLAPHQTPIALGGTYNYNTQFHKWIRSRLSVEHVLTSGAPTSLQRYKPSAVAAVTAVTAVAKRGTLKQIAEHVHNNRNNTTNAAANDNNNTATSELARRNRNALYSRRSFHRRKLEKLTLQDQVQVLQASNEALNASNLKLQQLLQQAMVVVAQYHQQQQMHQYQQWPFYSLSVPQQVPQQGYNTQLFSFLQS